MSMLFVFNLLSPLPASHRHTSREALPTTRDATQHRVPRRSDPRQSGTPASALHRAKLGRSRQAQALDRQDPGVAKTNFAEVALNTPANTQYKTQKRRLTSESGLMTAQALSLPEGPLSHLGLQPWSIVSITSVIRRCGHLESDRAPVSVLTLMRREPR